MSDGMIHDGINSVKQWPLEPKPEIGEHIEYGAEMPSDPVGHGIVALVFATGALLVRPCADDILINIYQGQPWHRVAGTCPAAIRARKVAAFEEMRKALRVCAQIAAKASIDSSDLWAISSAFVTLATADQIVSDETTPTNALTGSHPTAHQAPRPPEAHQSAVVAAGHDGHSLDRS